MMSRDKVAIFFLTALLFHDPIIALTQQPIIAHGLLLLSTLFYAFFAIIRLSKTQQFAWLGGKLGLIAILPFSFFGILYVVLDGGDMSVKAQFFQVFLFLPIIWSCLSRVLSSAQMQKNINNLIFAYVLVEACIISGQLSFLLFGFGFASNSIYDAMITGSQYNGNNLAAILCLLGIAYNMNKQTVGSKMWYLFQVLIFFCLLMTLSRLALMVYVFSLVIGNSGLNVKRILLMGSFLLVFFTIIVSIDSIGNDTVDNLINKAKSILLIFTIGFETDSSTMGRSESYLNFLTQLPYLGMGSVSILDYSEYTKFATFADDTLYINPHSMLIELGYWLGWIGLLLFTFLLFFLYSIGNRLKLWQKVWFICIALLVSSIPSSAIPLVGIWFGMMLLGVQLKVDKLVWRRI